MRRLVPVLLAVWSCDVAPEPSCVCTLSLGAVNVTVVDTAGGPVGGLTPTIVLLRNGRALELRGSRSSGARYTVISDLEISQINAAGEVLRFSVASPPRSVTADFTVDAPGECRCHIRKLAGPDTVVLR